ncbi:MAG: mevalonate kinase [bacterium]|nr:mevalonate kinase [bacterium]
MISAPAKVILFGEHAVVYGQPAIAAPVSSLRARSAIQSRTEGEGLRLIVTSNGQQLAVEIDPEDVNSAFSAAVRLVLRHLKVSVPPSVNITLESDIPVASGLGSGAAITTVLAQAVATAVGQKLDAVDLNQIVFEVEKIYHGTPSGIDNTVIVYEKPVYYVRNHPLELLTIPQPIILIVADTGVSASTKIAVGDVRYLYEREPERIQVILSSIGAVVQQARTAIENGDIEALGPLMVQNHAMLRTLTVSSPELEALVDAAMNAGALGAKLSGGGRGGNMIALVTPETAEIVQQALREAGATRALMTTIG